MEFNCSGAAAVVACSSVVFHQLMSASCYGTADNIPVQIGMASHVAASTAAAMLLSVGVVGKTISSE